MDKFSSNMLLDWWSVSGSNMIECKEYLQRISNVTKIMPYRTDEIQIMTVDQKKENGSLYGFMHNSKNGSSSILVSKERLLKDGINDEFYSETLVNSHLLFMFGDSLFFTTQKVLKTLCQRAGSNLGDAGLRDEMNIRFHRDAGYVAYMGAVPQECNICFREIGNMKKVFAIFSSQYTKIPQDQAFECIQSECEKKFGKTKLFRYNIDNFETEILMDIPSLSKSSVIPGLCIRMSDVGFSSFTVTGYIRMRNGIAYIPSAEFSRSHTKKASIEEIAISAVEMISDKFKDVIDLAERLQGIPVSPSIAESVIRSCGFKKELSATFENSLVEDVSRKLPKNKCRAYDIVRVILRECADYSENKISLYVNIIRRLAAKALFYDYEG